MQKINKNQPVATERGLKESESRLPDRELSERGLAELKEAFGDLDDAPPGIPPPRPYYETLPPPRKKKRYRVGLCAANVESMTWAVVHHALSMYESIDNTEEWEPMLLLDGISNTTITVRGHTYRSGLAQAVCDHTLDVVLFSSFTIDFIKQQCPDTHTILFNQGPTYFITIAKLVANAACRSRNATTKKCIISDQSVSGMRTRDPKLGGADTVWTTPHYTWQGEFLKELFGAVEHHECPYVWTPNVLRARYPAGFKYINGTADRVGVYETNRGIYKMSLMPMLIAEAANRRHALGFAHTRGLGDLYQEPFRKDFLPILQVGWEGGRNMGDLPKDWADNRIGTVLSHTLRNGLNNLWLEALYAGMALVHNSAIMRDRGCGYFYDDFNITDGANVLIQAMRTHDGNAARQAADTACLHTFATDNPTNVEWYARLLNRAMALRDKDKARRSAGASASASVAAP